MPLKWDAAPIAKQEKSYIGHVDCQLKERGCAVVRAPGILCFDRDGHDAYPAIPRRQ
jgi:hypothetical protein